MPLDWAQVMTRYDGGTTIPTVAGGKTLQITGVDGSATFSNAAGNVSSRKTDRFRVVR